MKKLTNKGFTLIEVVLVLAIGGLIFLLAFIAFQQVSANRRDTQRRSDAGRIVAELQNYYGDKRAYPVSDATGDICTVDAASPNGFRAFAKNYLCTGSSKDELKSPSGTNYRSVNIGAIFGGFSTQTDDIVLLAGFNCAFQVQSNSNAVIMYLEKGQVCRTLQG